MIKRVSAVIGLLALSLFWQGAAKAQAPSPEVLAAAKEFMAASKMADQIATAFPVIMQQLKPLITRGNPLAERDFDAAMPLMAKAMDTHMESYMNAGALIYARHFTADELRQLTSLYRSPAMEKFLQKQPEVAKETMVLGQKFGQAVGQDIQNRMIEELRKRGHNI